MRPLRLTGFWWDANNPSTRWAGTLRFTPQEGARLRLTIRTKSVALLDPSARPFDCGRILGVTTKGRPVTLFRCVATRYPSGGFPAIPRSVRIQANAVIVGFHCDEPDPLLTSASVSFRHFGEWFGRSAIEFDHSVQLPEVAARSQKLPPIVIRDDERFRISIRPYVKRWIGGRGVQLFDEPRVEISATKEPRPLSEFLRVSQACGDFLSIACLQLCDADRIDLVSPPGPRGTQRIGTYVAQPFYDVAHEKTDRRKMLFRFKDIEDRLETTWGGWLAHAEMLWSSRSLYLLGVYGDGYVESKLLSLTQAVESFHRRWHADRGHHMPKPSFKKQVLDPLKMAIPAGLPDALRQSLLSSIGHANQFSLRLRLEALVNEHSAALDMLTPDARSLMKSIVEVRNRFTHFFDDENPATEAASEDDEQVLRYNVLLQCLLELSFLSAMGLSKDEVTSIARRNGHYRRLSERFFSPSVP
jgi:hypothetical protein